MFFETTEAAIKEAVRQKENEEASQMITPISYMPESRVWIHYRGRAISGVKCNFKNSHKNDLECRFCPRRQLKLDLNGSQEFSEENQMFPVKIEEHFSVFEGTTSVEEQETVGLKNTQMRHKNTLRSAKGPKIKEEEYRTCQIGEMF